MTTHTWQSLLAEEKQKAYFQKILHHINLRRQAGITVYPEKHAHFYALQQTPFAKTKVVILGQDPYHGPGQAHGLSFSVPEGIALPPSLKNIFKALADDLNCSPPAHGDLTDWARQGVLLLNTVLSVEAHQAHSHANIGWEQFTDTIIQLLSAHHTHLVFLLWGAHARRKTEHIDPKHTVLTAAHPSPLSAHRGFLTCQHFSKANAALAAHQQSIIDWQIPATKSCIQD